MTDKTKETAETVTETVSVSVPARLEIPADKDGNGGGTVDVASLSDATIGWLLTRGAAYAKGKIDAVRDGSVAYGKHTGRSRIDDYEREQRDLLILWAVNHKVYPSRSAAEKAAKANGFTEQVIAALADKTGKDPEWIREERDRIAKRRVLEAVGGF